MSLHKNLSNLKAETVFGFHCGWLPLNECLLSNNYTPGLASPEKQAVSLKPDYLDKENNQWEASGGKWNVRVKIRSESSSAYQEASFSKGFGGVTFGRCLVLFDLGSALPW